MRLKFAKLVRDQWTTVPPLAREDLLGKTVVVTGANVGLGFEAAKHFARMNPGKLILACRSRDKGEKAVSVIKEETGCLTVELRLLDLASISSVKLFAQQFEDNNERLDILVENAAVTPGTVPEITDDGWEQTYVNHLSTALLGLLLLPRLLHTAKTFHTTPRLVFVTSELHFWAKITKEWVDSPNPLKTYGYKDYVKGPLTMDRYSQTKLMNVLFARALNERLSHRSKSPLIVNYTNPGLCYSSLRRDYSGLLRYAIWVLENAMARTAEEGGRLIIAGALGLGKNGNVDDLRGAYVNLAEANEDSDYVLSDEGKSAQLKLWDDLINELGEVEPSIKRIVEDYLS